METKAFWKSKTLQGLLPIIIGALLPKYAPAITAAAPGIDLICQGAGIVWTAYGRIKANSKVGLVSKPA